MNGKSLLYKAPAKVNLVLEVLGKRPDGFHELAMVFQALSLEDELEVRPASSDISVKIEGIPVHPPDGTNLVVKAAHLFFETIRINGGASFVLRKRIPVSAGLGGGSSDAAATLMALNELYAAHLPQDWLNGMAAKLGSDVAFFFTGGTALGTGRGEIIQKMPEIPSMHIVLVKPESGLSTAVVYGSGNISFSDGSKARSMGTRTASATLEGVVKELFNALEEPAFALMPEERKIRDELLDAGCRGAMVSGSGSTVFGIATSGAQAAEVALRLMKPGRFTSAVQTVPWGVRRVD